MTAVAVTKNVLSTLPKKLRKQSKKTEEGALSVTVNNVYDKSVADGQITWWALDENGNKIEVLHKSNTVLNTAREIMRDLLAGGGETITKCSIGSRGITFTDNLDITPTPVNASETILSNKIAEIPVLNIEKTTIDNRPAVTYSFKIAKDNNLGQPSDSFIIAECGLCTDTDRMFSKVVHKPIIKRPFAGLLLSWSIIF